MLGNPWTTVIGVPLTLLLSAPTFPLFELTSPAHVCHWLLAASESQVPTGKLELHSPSIPPLVSQYPRTTSHEAQQPPSVSLQPAHPAVGITPCWPQQMPRVVSRPGRGPPPPFPPWLALRLPAKYWKLGHTPLWLPRPLDHPAHLSICKSRVGYFFHTNAERLQSSD